MEHHVTITTLSFSSYINIATLTKIIDNTKVNFGFVKRLKWDTICKTIDYGCAYVWASNVVQSK